LYRKHFRVPAGGADGRHAVEFDGATANARIFLNGRELWWPPNGDIGFPWITPYLHVGEADNVMAVRLEAEEESTRDIRARASIVTYG
jgi:beta-galactosidase